MKIDVKNSQVLDSSVSIAFLNGCIQDIEKRGDSSEEALEYKAQLIRCILEIQNGKDPHSVLS